MKKRFNLLVLVLCLALSSNAQTQLKKWYINSAEYDMTTSTPTSVPLSNGQNGASNGIYDLNGVIQFYVNGNGNYDRFQNIVGTLGAINLSEVSIVPFFNNDPCHNKYYVFFQEVVPLITVRLKYVIVDVNRATGGLTFSSTITIVSMSGTGAALAIGNVINGTERFLYFVTSQSNTTNIIKYTLTNPSITNPNGIVLPGNTILSYSSNNYSGPYFEADLSRDGTKLAWGGFSDGKFYVLGLDANGNNPYLISSFNAPNSSSFNFGVEFNDNGSRLYASSGRTVGVLDGVYVWDIGSANPPTLISGTQNYGAGQIERAYNGYVYIKSLTNMIGIDQGTDLLVSTSQITVPGNKGYLPDQLDGTNYDNYLTSEMTFDQTGFTVLSGTQVWEPGNNPFGNTIGSVKFKDFINFESLLSSTFVQITIKNMVFEFGANSYLEIGNNATVILENTTLKAVSCASMWNGVNLLDNANFITTNNSTNQNSIIQDAITGVTGLGQNFHLTVHGNTLFTANQNDIYLTGYDGGNIDIHNSNFIGNVVLKDQFYGSKFRWTDNLYRTITQIKLNEGTNTTIIGNNCNFTSAQIALRIEKSNVVVNSSNFLNQKVYGISGDAMRISKKKIDIYENIFTTVQQPIRLENWINSTIQKNTFLSSKEYGIHYLANEGCEVTIGDETDSTKGNLFDFCNWVGIDLSSNANPKTKIIIGYNSINNHPYATGICISEYGIPSLGGSYKRLSINNNTMVSIGGGIKLNNIAGWNTIYSGIGPTPHDGRMDYFTVVKNNTINYVTSLYPHNQIGIQTNRSSNLNILYNNVTSDAPYDWRNCGILTDEAFYTSIYSNTSKGGLGIRIGGNMLISNVYCNDVSNSTMGIFLNYEYLRNTGSVHGIINDEARDNVFNSISGIDIKLYQTNTDFNQWIFHSSLPMVDYINATGPIPLSINGGSGNSACYPEDNGGASGELGSKQKGNLNAKILLGTTTIKPSSLLSLNKVELLKLKLKNAKDSLPLSKGKGDFANDIAIVEELFIRKQYDSACKIINNSKPTDALETEVFTVYNLIATKMNQKDRLLRKGETDTLLNIARKNQFHQSCASAMARIIIKEELQIDVYDSIEYFPIIKGKVGQDCAIGILGGLEVKLLTSMGIETGFSSITDSIGSFTFNMRDLQFLNAHLSYRFKCILRDSSVATCNTKRLGEFTNLKEIKLSCSLVLAKRAATENRINSSNFIDTKVYPNPNSGIFNIECANNTEVIIYNLLGKMVYSKSHSLKSEIDLRDLPKGLYLLNSRNETSKTFKLIIE